MEFMNYDWMTYENIKECRYPNLLAEIKESGYSICTISEFMGLGRCKEGNSTIWDKLTGKTEISVFEAAGLAKCFNESMEYLFADELTVIGEESQAYWKWYDENKRKQQELERSKEIQKIYDALVADPELLMFMKWCRTLTKEQRHEVLLILQKDIA